MSTDEKRAWLEEMKSEKVRATGEVILEERHFKRLISELDAAWEENERLFNNQVEWATEHPTYKLSKELEKELRETSDEKFLMEKERDALKAELEEAKRREVVMVQQREVRLDAALAREALVEALDQSIRQWEMYLTECAQDDLQNINHAEADELRRCKDTLEAIEKLRNK